MHFVLYCLEKADADIQGGIVVNGGRIDISDFSIDPLFRGADIQNTAEQLVKIAKGLIRIFQAFVVRNKTFEDKLTDLERVPLPKLVLKVLGTSRISE